MNEPGSGPLVAIVEDDAAIAEGLALNLKLQGYRTEVMGDGETARRRIEAGSPDLVLLDITLPKQSGLWVLERLREAENHVPVIVLSARQHLVERLEGYQRESAHLFHQVIGVIDQDFVPAILVQAVTGLAELTSDNALFADPLARRMLVDVLNERGYRTTATVEMRDVPTRIDPATYDIVLTSKPRYHFEVHFQGSQIRRGN